MREARLKVSPAFSKVAGCRGRALARAPLKRGTLLMLHKDQEGGLRGKPYQGVSPLYLFLRFVRVRRYAGRWSLPCPAFRPHFFGACPKKWCRAAKEKRFLPRRLHHPRERYKSVDYTFLARLLQGAGGVVGLFNLLTKARFLRASKDMGVIRLQNISGPHALLGVRLGRALFFCACLQ